MKFYKKLFIALSSMLASICTAQKIELLSTNVKSSLRGLCVVDENIIWASGSNGTVLKSTNGGKSFTTIAVKGFEKKDFRDIEAFDSNTAIIMAIAEPAYILKTIDGGITWKTVFTDSTKGMFLDAMYFKDANNGIVIGDPISFNDFLEEKKIAPTSPCINLNGNVAFIATTNDAGNTWQKFTTLKMLDTGESFFASSGSNIALNKNKTFFVSGGKQSNLYFNNKKFEIPINKGLESTGANSISIEKSNVIIVGGDFKNDSAATNNCVLFNTKTLQFTQPKTYPTGYRSCVIQLQKGFAITCGINGVDMSTNYGMNWKNISKEGFHVVVKAKKGKAVFFAGSKGRIGKFIYE